MAKNHVALSGLLPATPWGKGLTRLDGKRWFFDSAYSFSITCMVFDGVDEGIGGWVWERVAGFLFLFQRFDLL